MAISRREFIGRTAALAAGCMTLGAGAGPRGFTFIQMADTQLGMGGYEHDVETFRLAARQINATRPDFVMICGDLINETADDKAFADFNAIRNQLSMPCYCVPGNHDVGNEPTPDLLRRYRKLVGRDYYCVEHKSHSFVFLNTQLWKNPIEGETERQHAWLKAQLAAAHEKRMPIVVVGHIPLYGKTPDEPEEYFNFAPDTRQELLELFSKHGVAAVLTGHTHRIVTNEYSGMKLVCSGSTSKNFDGAPMGYTAWTADRGGLAFEYTPIQGATPPEDKK